MNQRGHNDCDYYKEDYSDCTITHFAPPTLISDSTFFGHPQRR